ncbi:MAG: helix-turn-helix domain-containing protein [Spirochaetaceae bacterium]|nr:helix-turn-helix domain-containing protein [Spirochaetaceae bacterium]
MKNIGAKLQAAREEKGLSVEDVARETNIARKYIAALEAENFSEFPAEAYVIGFLKNYGGYLGLDTQELYAQYKILKIQEQPVPVDELLYKSSNLPRVMLISGVVLCGAAFILGIAFFIINITKRLQSNASTVRKSIEYNFSDGIFEQRLYKEDSISIPSDGSEYKIELQNIGDAVTLSTPRGNIMLELNQDATIDINNNGLSELLVQVLDYAPNNIGVGALLRLEINNVLPAVDQAAPDQAGIAAPVQNVPEIRQTAASSQVLLTGVNPYPFTLEVSFQGHCMFRWEILREAGRQNRKEQYFVRGDEVNIQAQNGVRLWMSNAGVTKIKAVGGGLSVPLDIGPAGTVAVADILWRRGEDGRYNLMLSRLEN